MSNDFFNKTAEKVRKSELSHREQRLTCHNCSAPLSNNDLVKDAYGINNDISWAKIQLRILGDMMDYRGHHWIAGKLHAIGTRLRTLG